VCYPRVDFTTAARPDSEGESGPDGGVRKQQSSTYIGARRHAQREGEGGGGAKWGLVACEAVSCVFSLYRI
jgi:hypothetical protein